ncbi:MAG: Gldg family protein, partial [Porcipelethomonas sp.]
MSKDTAKEKKPFNKKKLKYGAAATVITIFVIAIVVVINLIAGILTEKKGFKLDLTSQKYFDVSQDTIDYIKNIDVDVEIAVMAEKSDLEGNTYNKMVVETLAKYEQNSDHIKVSYYDIAENPDVISKYASSYNGEITEGNIVIANGDRVKVTSITSLFTVDTSSYYQTGSYSYSGYKGEQEITSALMSVTDANPVKAAIIAKYNGEAIYPSDLGYAISSLVQMLDKNGYEYELVDMLSDDLSPDEYDLAILPAPMNDLTDDSIKKLEDFLYNDGNLDKNMIYIADILQRKTPKIDEFLEVWGIEVGGNQVIESSADKIQQVNVARNTYGLTQQAKAPVVTIADSSYSEGLSNTKLPIVAPAARNINLLFDANVDRTTTALL